MDPDPNQDPGHLFKQKMLLKKQNFYIFVLFFSLIFILKLEELDRNQIIFRISFFNSSDLGFESKILGFCSVWLIF